MRKFVSDSGNYGLCKDCETIIVLKQQWFKTPNHAWREKSFKMVPYCPTCDKFRNYKTMIYIRELPEETKEIEK